MVKCGGGEECLCGVDGGIKTGQAVLFLLPEQCSCSSSLGDGMTSDATACIIRSNVCWPLKCLGVRREAECPPTTDNNTRLAS